MRQDSSGYEFRIKSLTDEVNSLRAMLSERESAISKLRLEFATSSTRLSSAQSGEVESQKKELMRLTSIIDSLRMELSITKSQLEDSKIRVSKLTAPNSVLVRSHNRTLIF